MPYLLHEVDSAFTLAHGFEMTGLYCQLTGKRIGQIDYSELEALIDSIGGDGIEEIVDDIAMRVLASMRPSIRWNRLRAETLTQMSESAPTETLAYLLNRLFAPLEARRIRIMDRLGDLAQRIKTFQTCESWGQTDATNTLMYMLLELDAKWNLDTESAPFSAKAFFDAESMDLRVEMLQAWYLRRCDAYDKKVKADEMQVKWSRSGNAVAKPAFLAIYLKSKPISKTAANREAKQAESDFMLGLLNEIMIEDANPHAAAAVAPPATPVFVPIRKMPMKFGVK